MSKSGSKYPMFDMTVADFTKGLRLLGDLGVRKEDWSNAMKNPERLAEFLRRGCLEPLPNEDLAREIMGDRFYGTSEVTQAGFRYTANDMRKLSIIPWPASELRRYAKTHVLVAGTPDSTMSTMLGLWALYPTGPTYCEGMFKDFDGRRLPWFNDAGFANDATVEQRWYLVSTGIFPGTDLRTHKDQMMVFKHYERGLYLPSACLLFYCAILADILKRGHFSGDDLISRDNDGTDSHHIAVTCNGDEGINVRQIRDDEVEELQGLATAVQPVMVPNH